ncbi:MAG: class I SAM-dependent methyltransferase [Candidatus Omnitrophica bacterium]|nr:class I SAM-dependent methyltransferase [Candidatus Omnitrophota bacterium]
MDRQGLYRIRFKNQEKKRQEIWRRLCWSFFQRFIRNTDRVIDIGAGYCEFINNIQCQEKYALEINPRIKEFAHPEVKVVIGNATHLSSLPEEYFDKVFMSNFFRTPSLKEKTSLDYSGGLSQTKKKRPSSHSCAKHVLRQRALLGLFGPSYSLASPSPHRDYGSIRITA